MADRRLAHIETIREVIPHNNADNLEIVKVLGWTLCVLRGQFQAGEQVVFVEPDAILPEGKPEWEFMRTRHFKVKTIKLRGVISQGLVFKLSICGKAFEDSFWGSDTREAVGEDVTELLGITKYQPYIPAQLAGTVKGSFPDFLHKTDEMRIQAVPELLEKHQGKKFYVTEKLDGSSMTVYLNNGEFGVCSRNQDLKETEGNAYWKVVRTEGIEEEMRYLAADPKSGLKNFAVQGELVGPGVQGNKYKLQSLGFYIFNVFNIDTRRYIDLKPIQGPHENFYVFDFIVESGFFAHVPLLTIDYLLPKTIEELVEFSKGKSLLNKDTHREGIVLRPLVEEFSEELRGRLSFKCINPEFLLKYEE